MSRHNPGTTRRKLAEMLCRETGALFEAHNICQNNNRTVHYEDCCRWDAWGWFPKTATLPPMRLHVYSWDQMGRCAKWGIDISKCDHLDWEISHKTPAKLPEK